MPSSWRVEETRHTTLKAECAWSPEKPWVQPSNPYKLIREELTWNARRQSRRIRRSQSSSATQWRPAWNRRQSWIPQSNQTTPHLHFFLVYLVRTLSPNLMILRPIHVSVSGACYLMLLYDILVCYCTTICLPVLLLTIFGVGGFWLTQIKLLRTECVTKSPKTSFPFSWANSMAKSSDGVSV